MYNTPAYFNNFDLNGLAGVKIVNYNVSDMPSRTLNSSKLARANRSLLTSAEYATKTITITGFIGGSTTAILYANFNRLKGHLQDIEGIVRVSIGGSDVEYIGTLNGISKSFVGENINFTLSFLCSNPIGRDAVGSELFAPTNITSATLTKSFTVDGSFAATPRFHFVITSVTGGTTKSITLLNAASLKGIRVTRTWANGDILDINSDTFEVVVNGASIDFVGQFPTFLPGGRTLQYIDDFTTRDITLSTIYTRQYA